MGGALPPLARAVQPPLNDEMTRHAMMFVFGCASCQGRGNYFEVAGGGLTSPGVQGNPLKTYRIWPTIFGERPKFTNERHCQSKVGGRGWRSHSFQVGGESCLHCPPPPPVRVSLPAAVTIARP